MFCDSENLPSLVDPPQSQFKSKYMWGNLDVSISRFDRARAHTHTHIHTVQKRKLFRTVMSNR